MKKLFVLSLLSCVILFSAFLTDKTKTSNCSGLYKAKSAGPPLCSSGAPGEETCAYAGCHDGAGSTPNTGPGIANISFSGANNEYVPGQTYTFMLSLNQSNVQRFGFQATVIKNADDSTAGNAIITDAVRTWMFEKQGWCGIRRQWVEHTFDGIAPVAAAWGEWSFDWTAPSTNVGDITIYSAMLAANTDLLDTLDQTYTNTLTITPQTTGTEELADNNRMQIFPNPSEGKFEIRFKSMAGMETVEVFNVLGEKINQQPATGNQKFEVDLSLQPEGIYFVKLISGDQSWLKRVVVVK